MGTGDVEGPWGAWGWLGRALMPPSEMGPVGDPEGTQNAEPQMKQGQELPTCYVPSKTLGGKGRKPAKISLAFLFFPEAGYSLAGVPSSFPSKHSKEGGNKTLLPWAGGAVPAPPSPTGGRQRQGAPHPEHLGGPAAPGVPPGGVSWPSRVPARRQEVGTHRRGTGSHSSPHRRALQSTPAPAPAGAAGARGRAGYCGADKGPLLRDLCSGTGRGRWGAQLCLPPRSERWVSSQPPPLSPATGTPPPHGCQPCPGADPDPFATRTLLRAGYGVPWGIVSSSGSIPPA